MKKFFLALIITCLASSVSAEQLLQHSKRGKMAKVENQQLKPLAAKVVDNSQNGFNIYLTWGVDVNSYLAGGSFDVSLGSRINQYVYVGGGTGLHLKFGYQGGVVLSQPIYANCKVFLPTKNRDFYPHLDVKMGAAMTSMFFREYAEGPYFGLFTGVGAGIDYRRFTIGAGYQYCSGHIGYLNIGLRILR